MMFYISRRFTYLLTYLLILRGLCGEVTVDSGL